MCHNISPHILHSQMNLHWQFYYYHYFGENACDSVPPLRPLLALTIFGDITHLEITLFVSHIPMWSGLEEAVLKRRIPDIFPKKLMLN
jgi:hypothetical protein